MPPPPRTSGRCRRPVRTGAGAGHRAAARSRQRGVQHRCHDPLAGLQRHLAGRRVGASLRQPGRLAGTRRCSLPRAGRRYGRCCDRRHDRARPAPRPDPGLRDPGRAGPGERLQPAGPGSRAAGAGGERRGRCAAAGRRCRAGGGGAVARLPRRRRAAHLPPRRHHRIAQVVGRRRRHQSRPVAGLPRAARRDGLPGRAERAALGLPRRGAARW